MKDSDYRKNVGIMMLTPKREVLAGESIHYKGEWMMPQGGVETEETLEQTLWRELEEETGIAQSQVSLVDSYPTWIYYKIRRPLIENNRVFLGQKQQWFLLEYNGPIPDADSIVEKEFSQFQFVTPDWLLENSSPIKGEVYKQLFDHFL